MASAAARLSQHAGLVTENWIFPSVEIDGQMLMINALALRLMGEHLACDVGAIRIPGAQIPIPWLDVTYHWD